MPTRYHVGTSTPASDNAAGIMASLATLFAVATDVDTGAAVSAAARRAPPLLLQLLRHRVAHEADAPSARGRC